jgi:predicted membrane protein
MSFLHRWTLDLFHAALVVLAAVVIVAGTLVVVVPGAVEQVEMVVHGNEVVAGEVPEMVSAFTRTGMTAPVLRPKTWCPSTANIPSAPHSPSLFL